jgi:hypothetical protein
MWNQLIFFRLSLLDPGLYWISYSEYAKLAEDLGASLDVNAWPIIALMRPPSITYQLTGKHDAAINLDKAIRRGVRHVQILAYGA